MTRPEKVAAARQHLCQGLTIPQIAAAMSVSERTVRRWFADPTGEKALERKHTRCDRCGAPRHYLSISLCWTCYDRSRALRCLECNTPLAAGPPGLCGLCTGYEFTLVTLEPAKRAQERWAGYRAAVEKMWADGLTGRQIAERMGWKYRPSKIAALRLRGYNLPHRLHPEFVDRARAEGWTRLRAAAWPR